MQLLETLKQHAATFPDKTALRGMAGTLGYGALLQSVDAATGMLANARIVAIAVDNDPAWAIIDLACMQLGLCTVPLPAFFSDQQVIHALRDAGVDTLICDQGMQQEQRLAAHGIRVISRSRGVFAGRLLTLLKLELAETPQVHPGTRKITYTSGTTGNPKGVCLDAEAMMAVAASLAKVAQASASDRHLSLLPLPVLLENIAGLYLPLLVGAESILLPSSHIGLNGASGMDIPRLLNAITEHAPTTLLLIPELLRVLVAAAEAGWKPPVELRMIAVGGGHVSPVVLERAQVLGLPVCEGYGLSECASVVAFNSPGRQRPGSVGMPLPHLEIAFATDGEILVKGAHMLGYVGEHPIDPETHWATGDIGYLDEDGYLYINGRKKNLIISSYGRNISPEWVERELGASALVGQAVVFGDGRPFLTAVIVPSARAMHLPDLSAHIDAAITEMNARLPDYARIHKWILATEPFTPVNGQLTPNGRPRREAVSTAYADQIHLLYEEEETHAVL